MICDNCLEPLKNGLTIRTWNEGKVNDKTFCRMECLIHYKHKQTFIGDIFGLEISGSDDYMKEEIKKFIKTLEVIEQVLDRTVKRL